MKYNMLDEINDFRASLQAQKSATDYAYSQRNELAVAFAKMATYAGCTAGRGRDTKQPDEGWQHVVYVDTPDGRQVSWHMSPDSVPLLDGLPEYQGEWDGTFFAREAGWSRDLPCAAQAPGDPAGSFEKHMEYMRENIALKKRIAALEELLLDIHPELACWHSPVANRIKAALFTSTTLDKGALDAAIAAARDGIAMVVGTKMADATLPVIDQASAKYDVPKDMLEALLISKDNFYQDEVEDIAHALAQECEDAELDPGGLVTINREKLKAIAVRVLNKAKAALSAAVALDDSAPVERLHAEIERRRLRGQNCAKKVIVLRAQLADQDALLAEGCLLLREIRHDCNHSRLRDAQIDGFLHKALSARAEPSVQMVRAHKHTCANVQPGSTSADVCDCGAMADGKPVPVERDDRAELSAKNQQLSGFLRQALAALNPRGELAKAIKAALDSKTTEGASHE